MRSAFLLVGAAWFAMMAGSNLATPLYAVYEHEFGFSSAVLTVVFATYALVLAPSLLVFGQLSDRLGRRRVLAGGFATATVGLGLFAVAGGLAWLFAARAVQGLAVGMISGAAAAALVELDPAPDEDRAALLAALAQAGGSASGPLVAGLLAEWAPARLVLPFAIFIVLGIAAVAVALAIPEPNAAAPRHGTQSPADGAAPRSPLADDAAPSSPPADRAAPPANRAAPPANRAAPPADGGAPPAPPARARLIQRPSVPAPIRVLFARVSVTGAAVWATAALYLSVVPSYAARLLDTSNLALIGAICAAMLITSCVAQIAARRRSDHARLQATGLVLLALGLAALVIAFPARSLLVLLASALLTGAGHGLAFLGAQAQLNLAAPSDRRGEVNAAFY
ncbi:MAG TPA: MFS transporter, partial [Solirubrobacter sp.]|nr:MFS transporter [Solirubrobacter sp.]